MIVTAGVSMAATAALAADPLAPGPYPAAPGQPNWGGMYVGLEAGGAWGDAAVRDTTGGVLPGPFSYHPSGALAGATVGLNWQAGGLVVGVEGDLGFMNLTGTGVAPSSAPGQHQDLTLAAGLYGDASGRLGWAFGPWLVYGKGGFAFYTGEARQTTTNPGYITTGTGVFTGWVAGAGVERNVGGNMSVRLEYAHFDFGSQGGAQTSIADPPIGFIYANTTKLTSASIGD